MKPARDFGRGDSARMYSLWGDCFAGLGMGVLLRMGRSSVSCILNFCVERPGDRGSVGRIFAGGRIMDGGGFFIGLGFFGGEGGGDVPTPIETICGRSGTGSFVSGHCSSRIFLDSSMIRLDSSALRRKSSARASCIRSAGLVTVGGAEVECTGGCGGGT